MVAISSSQKKTAFAVVLVALIAVWVMISGRGGFSGLRSDAFNNPSFVCSEATQTADKEKYDRSGTDIQNFSAEKAGLQTKIQWWNSDIRKNEASIKKLERKKATAEKKERALEVAVKKHCTPRALATCAAKKQELQDVRQEIKQIRNSLVSERNQNKNIRTSIQSAESSVKLLEKQIQEIQSFKEDYETCKGALADNKPLDKLIFRSPTMLWEVQFSGLTGSQVLLYDFSMEFPSTPSTIFGEVAEKSVTIGSLSLSAVFPLDTISFKDWIIVYPLPGHHDGAVVFSCSYAKNEGTLKCSPRDGQDLVLRRGEAARWLQLYAVLDEVTWSWSFKIHGVTGIGHSIPLETEILTTSIKYNYGSTVLDLCNNITGIQTTVPAGTAQNSAGGCVCANGGANPPTCTVEEPTCTNLTVSPTSVTNGGNVNYTCTGTNATSYSIVAKRPDGTIITTSTSPAGSIIIPTSPTGTYTVSCFINGQTTTPAACQKTINNIQPSTPVDTFTVSLDWSTPLNKILLDNTSEHTIAAFRLAAPNTEDLDVDSIKITDDGTNGNDVVRFYKFYNGATLLGTVTPDGSGNAELFLADRTLVIPANDYKLVIVKAILNDIDGTGFVNGDTLKATIANIGDIKTTGTTSGNSISSTQTNISGNIMTVYEAYPIVSFAFDSNMGSTINLGSNQLIAKIALTNPGNKDVTFQSGDGNNFSIQVQIVGDDTDTAPETVTLKDQDGTTIDTANITSASGLTQIDFNMSSVSAGIGTTIPYGQTKYFYIFMDTSDLEDNGDEIQVWLDDTAADVTFGINGTGAYAVGDFVFRGDIFGPVLSRSF